MSEAIFVSFEDVFYVSILIRITAALVFGVLVKFQGVSVSGICAKLAQTVFRFFKYIQ